MTLNFTDANDTFIPTTNIFKIDATGALVLPNSTTANRPSTPADGMIRYNSSTNLLESYVNSGWRNHSFAAVYNSSGLVLSPKVWIGTVTTGSTGTFTVNISSASFSSILGISAIVVSNTTTITSQPWVTIQTVSTTSIGGTAIDDSSTTSILGINVEGVENAGTGLTVYITVIGT
jgi:hypothetical protein